MKQKNSKIIRFPRQFQFSIGIIIFGIVLIYVVFHIFTFLTAKTITIYEVSQGTIATNHEYQALALRKEEVVVSREEGAVLYYAPNVERVGVRTLVCAIDQSGKVVSKLAHVSSNISDVQPGDMKRLQRDIRSFANDFDTDTFSRVYGFKTNITSQLEQTYSRQALTQLADQITAAQNAGTFHMYYGTLPGIVVYGIDGWEDVSVDNFTYESLDSSQNKVTNLKSQDKILVGQALYKVITSDHWNLVIEIDEKTAEALAEESYVEIRFCQDDATTWAECRIESKAGHTYLILSLDDSVERYGDSRFLSVELLLSEESGLKIPNSAIADKEFYTIPKGYFYRGNDDQTMGLMVENADGENSFVTPTIFYETEDSYYIDNEQVNKGDILLKPDSNHTYQVGRDSDHLKGVYNVNKGYAVFKQIEILYQNEDYTIVRTGTPYGIALYDRIALQGDSVRENDLIQ